jgi:two-component system response regulator AtoC
LTRYHWPGNVRELENIIERTIILSRHSIILPEDLPWRFRIEPSEISSSSLPSQISLVELEKIHIKKILEETGGNKKKAADILGIDRRTLYRMAARYGINLKR